MRYAQLYLVDAQNGVSDAFSLQEQVAKLCHDVGFKQVSLSSGTLSMKKIVPRGLTYVSTRLDVFCSRRLLSCAADAYLTPLIRQYVESFSRGFDENFKVQTISFACLERGPYLLAIRTCQYTS